MRTLDPQEPLLHIFVLFRFNHEPGPTAVTGVEGDVTDLLLPAVGDVVRHRDAEGSPFEGKVTSRMFEYDMGQGNAVTGAVAVTLWMDRTVVQ